ncbi:hypothetical protein B0H11DRAFT_2249615 [Mycena galericulata]|nr:hypothetical protein B0H11DRAFT_2249615 [Mycena galericulata]
MLNSKFLAFGLGVLALVRAAPSAEAPVLSCSTDVLTSGNASAFGVLIGSSMTFSDELNSCDYHLNETVYLSLTPKATAVDSTMFQFNSW